MTEIVINNKSFLERLEKIRNTLFSFDEFGGSKFDFYEPDDARTKGQYYVSDEYLEIVKSRSEDYGWPEEHFSHPVGRVYNERLDINEFYNDVKYNFAMEIGAKANALFNYYPPGGFVGWHNNWNASARQVLFTWSETGDGYFKYQDNITKEIITIPDVAGWQARHYNFGRQENDRCWHAAYTGCKRLTMAWKFGSDQDILFQDLIQELEETV